jgi:pimeloyl-ACP methyl ester carboxylesterase
MNIQKIYDYAKLATLSYVDLSEYAKKSDAIANVINKAASSQNPGKTERIPKILGTQMFAPTDNISTDITGKWSLLDPYFKTSADSGHSDPDSGFAAMLLSNDTYGKVLAIAGTEPGGPEQLYWDLEEADVHQIGFWGIAFGQVVSLYNYVQVLRGTGKVDQLKLMTGQIPPANLLSYQISAENKKEGTPATYLWLEKTEQADGRGLLSANEQLTVTGHSLGGHVSALAVALFPDLFTAAITFNAPGYNPLASLATFSSGGADKLLGLFKQFGAQPASVASIAPKVSTFESEDSIPGDDSEAIAGDLTGTPFSTEQYITVEKNTHDVGHTMDGLALQASLARLDPTLTYQKAGNFINAASSDAGQSYEQLLKALYWQMTGNKIDIQNTEPGIDHVGAGDFAKRSDYYDKLIGFTNDAIFKTLVGKLKIDISPANLDDRARTDFSAFISLFTLSPITLSGTNASNQASLEALQKTAWEPEYQQWHDDIAKSDAERTFTDTYLQDRAAMLFYVVQANQRDIDNSIGYLQWVDAADQSDHFFSDKQNNTTILVTGGAYPSIPGINPAITFGSQSDDAINGGAGVDHIYGDAGNDVISGNAGNDYLEGNAGIDFLNGGDDRTLSLVVPVTTHSVAMPEMII